MKTRYAPYGVHLFDRVSGLNVLLDEVAPQPALWSKAPRYVSIGLTNACELACPYCYASKEPARLKAEAVLAWATSLDQAGCFGVGFGGGEPTLYPRFAELCRDVHHKTRLAVTFTTHGHRFTPELVDALAGHVDFIRLSMDGLGGTYERLRGRPFAGFEDKLRLVKETARFGINYVVNDTTITDLPAAAEFTFASGAQELLLLPETGADGRLAISPETLAELSKWIGENHGRVRLATSSHAVEALEAPRLLPNAAAEHESFDFMHVDAFGTLKLTAFAKSGVQVSDFPTIVDAIERLRGQQTKVPQRTEEQAT